MTNEVAENRETAAPMPAEIGTGSEDSTTSRERRQRALTSLALPGLLVILVAVFSALRPSTFATWGDAKAILLTQSALAVLAMAAMLPLIIGEFDLSIGANLGLGEIAVTGLIAKQHFTLVPAIIGALILCTGVGFINGLLVAKVRINAFIATLGTGTIISGLVLWYTNSSTIFSGLPPSLSEISQNTLVGVPLPAIYLLIVALTVWYVLGFTPLGRYFYALGGSQDASRLAGLNVDRLILLNFSAGGLLCGLAGVLEAAGLGVGDPNVGPPLLLAAFAAAFLGATAIKVGTFNVWGTMLAVFTVAIGITGLALVGVPDYVDSLFTGGALILAVTATRYLNRDAQ